MKLGDFRVLTFDCYGTLIDWETGIYTALGPMLTAGGLDVSRDRVLETFAEHESAQQRETPAMRYPELLARVHARLAEQWNVNIADDLHARFGASVPHWPAFLDAAESLAYLKRHYALVILSNVDRESFAASNRQLEVEFDAIYTAEDIGSYKPDPANFEYLLEHLEADLGFGRSDILHTAQSLFHDHEPAKRVGLATAWIDRRQGRGWGATRPPGDRPEVDFHFPDLAAMVAAHRAEIGAT
ncbi:MAG: haloacid dehalogenase type II [Gammaproteobacteria bacterium]|nr:haloacid dehalogenase type II [Gammaproteobacteria bacterium]